MFSLWSKWLFISISNLEQYFCKITNLYIVIAKKGSVTNIIGEKKMYVLNLFSYFVTLHLRQCSICVVLYNQILNGRNTVSSYFNQLSTSTTHVVLVYLYRLRRSLNIFNKLKWNPNQNILSTLSDCKYITFWNSVCDESILPILCSINQNQWDTRHHLFL